MCGIIGIVGAESDAAPMLLDALKRLEYRGYDSAGIATLNGGKIERRRAAGKLVNLEAVLSERKLQGRCGIGHTRWATHGRPTENNAHPHQSGPVAVVHNGIIENFAALRSTLQTRGHQFVSETDTETIAHLFAEELSAAGDITAAFGRTLSQLEGAFALAVLIEGDEEYLLGARKGSPLVIGVTPGARYLGSDALAVAPFTDEVIYLEEGDWCLLREGHHQIYDASGTEVERPVTKVGNIGAAAEKGPYRHFMLKEIHEQPDSLARTLEAYVDGLRERVRLPWREDTAIDFSTVGRIVMVACGTAHYATCVAEYWFEQIAKLPTECDIASEFRYREPPLGKTDLAILVSQSGETADTLAALRYCKSLGVKTLAVVNVTTSTIAREADLVLPTLAGPEIGVASTKAFTAQLAVLACIAVAAGVARDHVIEASEQGYVDMLRHLPALVGETLALEDEIAALSQDISKARDVIFLGRGLYFPIALEGALKLKEISYIHAEGYASGELKHGPIALIDEATPVIFIAPADHLFEKSVSNLEEVVARQGRVFLFTNEAGRQAAGTGPERVIIMPGDATLFAPIAYAVTQQLLAYHVATALGTDVDQPRNLAKSVTVE